MPDPLDYGWWLASRSAGIVALLAASASVILGLMMANGIPRRPGAKRRLLWAHESLALTTLVAIAAHGLLLLPDAWLKPGLAGIAIPFAGDYRPFYTGLGIIAGWATILLGLSYYARRRIGTARWRSIHRFTIAAWALGVIHTIGAGTDAGQAWMTVLVLASVVPVAVLFAMRLMQPAGTPAARPAVPGDLGNRGFRPPVAGTGDPGNRGFRPPVAGTATSETVGFGLRSPEPATSGRR